MRDLLTHRLPRCGRAEGQALRAEGEEAHEAALRLVAAIDESYLAIQGPPGSGKSTIGAEMIVDLVAEGQRIGVTANSHKVIGELLAKVARVASERGVGVDIGQRSNNEPTFGDSTHLKTNDAARDELAGGSLDVVGATTWLWSREDMIGSVDVLFIDEAGQMSLADALAASLCASNLVLLGDPQQLDQPLQGRHPPGAERSALAHVLDGDRVMPDQFGLFLDGSWRLHPEISAYTSEAFYEGRLLSHPGRELLTLTGAPPLSGTGIRFVPVSHRGQSNESPEEAAEVAALVRDLLESAATYTDAAGVAHTLAAADVLLITPYNAQVRGPQRSAPGFPHRHGRQVSGPRGADLDLFDGDELLRRSAARDGVPVQPQPAERRHEPRAVPRCGGRQPRTVQGALSHAPADAARERARAACRDGH